MMFRKLLLSKEMDYVVTVQKKMAMCKKDDKLSQQKNIKFHFFIARKAVGLSLDIWHPRKALQSLLQNI